ncbi:hypothetical protein HK096_003040 [Nowakowskiella sp. JEL0078]|nr:hypothetical protein HK096_003040 [Nowakowskiella sp. JEL0078]
MNYYIVSPTSRQNINNLNLANYLSQYPLHSLTTPTILSQPYYDDSILQAFQVDHSLKQLLQSQNLYNFQSTSPFESFCNSSYAQPLVHLSQFQCQTPAILSPSFSTVSSLSGSTPTSPSLIDCSSLIKSDLTVSPTDSDTSYFNFSHESPFHHSFAAIISEVEGGGIISADGPVTDFPTEQPLVINTSDMSFAGTAGLEGFEMSPALVSSPILPLTCNMEDIYSEHQLNSTINKAGLVLTSQLPNDFGSDLNIQACFNFSDSTTLNEAGTPSGSSTIYSFDEDSDDYYSDNDGHEFSYLDTTYSPTLNEIRAPVHVARITKSTMAGSSIDTSKKWVCREGDCNRAYRGRSGLRYHREKVHELFGPIPQSQTPIPYRNANGYGGVKKDFSPVKRTTRPSSSSHSRINSADINVAEFMAHKLETEVETKCESDVDDITVVPPFKFKPGKWVCGVPKCTKVYSGRSGLRYHRQTTHGFYGTVPNTLYCPPNST